MRIISKTLGSDLNNNKMVADILEEKMIEENINKIFSK